jgi:hypothetical protein
MKRFKLITVLIIIALIVLLSSCSASWHIQKARQKDPTIFELFKETKYLKAPSVGFQFDCDSLYSRPIVFIKPRTYKDENGKDKTDSVRIVFTPIDKKLSPEDSLNIKNAFDIEVDCPDPVIITEKEMVYIKPTFWEKFKYALASLALSVLLFIALRTFKVL